METYYFKKLNIIIMSLNLLDIPSEVITVIIGFNDIYTYNKLLIVSKNFNVIINDNKLLWEYYLKRDYKNEDIKILSLIKNDILDKNVYKKCFQTTKLITNNNFKIQNVNKISDLWFLQRLHLESNQIKE